MDPDILDQLGLAADTAARTVDLAHGIRLTFRPPTSLDFTRAGQRAAASLEAAAALKSAIDRYGLSKSDLADLADPEIWEGASAFITSVELALLIVTAVERRTGDGESLQVWSVAPSAEALSTVLRHEGSLTAFMKATQAAGEELIQPKKECAPSPGGFGPAAARTAGPAVN
ncbi:MAG: hypothetical protein Q8L23_15920 [Caulobacter sp.]|nr:hypothetical protein [Caulobacter sp.]